MNFRVSNKYKTLDLSIGAEINASILSIGTSKVNTLIIK